MLNEIMAQLDTRPEETVVIGDSEYDLGMASNAGTDAIAVTSGVHARERLLAWLPRACLDSIMDLPHWLDGVNRSSLET
jgi:phosphoglycolate phosphatase